jgi:hypothetical protein
MIRPKAWEQSAQGDALGRRDQSARRLKACESFSHPFGVAGWRVWVPRALPWAEHSQAFGL